MPVIDKDTALPVHPGEMQDWIPLHRIENTGGDVGVVSRAIQTYPFQKLLYAEGDSWFDKFTPLPTTGTNLLEAIRLPVFAGVVDVSHIGDVSSDMVRGWQRRQTRAMFKLFDFDAILLSAGGNDLKNLFASLYDEVVERQEQGGPVNLTAEKQTLAQGQVEDKYFDQVLSNIAAFIALRDAAKSDRTRRAPLVLHGYDYLQPRPAPATLFAGTRLGSGPWIYPSLHLAGLTDEEMLQAARRVIDKLNSRLRSLVAGLPEGSNVYFLDQRGLLKPASAGSTGRSGDWMDEIHATGDGYRKLADQRWSPWLAKIFSLV